MIAKRYNNNFFLANSATKNIVFYSFLKVTRIVLIVLEVKLMKNLLTKLSNYLANKLYAFNKKRVQMMKLNLYNK
jgi:hypothetical protein